MGIASTGCRFAAGTLRVLAAGLVAGTVAAVAPASPSVAQSLGGPAETSGQMLLEADTLTYDNDAGVVTAAGNVRIDYNGIRLVAQRVSFYRESKRLVAYGNVQMVDREGNKSFAEEIDVTDNLRTGFVNALRIETTDKTYFASESAEQQSEDVTRFNNGVYTACEPGEAAAVAHSILNDHLEQEEKNGLFRTPDDGVVRPADRFFSRVRNS